MKYIYHHLGLGDHIICNALVRKFSSEYEQVSLFCKIHNKESVEFMYRDLNNLKVISLTDDKEVINYLLDKSKSDIILVGFQNMYFTGSNNFDVSFYSQFGIEFDFRWSNFKLIRDIEREEKLFKYFNLDENSEYIFLHDDDRFHIDINKIDNKEISVIKPNRDLTNNIFDYIKIIENAKEVHTIESSFLFIIDSLSLNKETYAHRYPRIQGYMETPVYKSVKKIIN